MRCSCTDGVKTTGLLGKGDTDKDRPVVADAAEVAGAGVGAQGLLSRVGAVPGQ